MKIEIKNRYTYAVLYSTEVDDGDLRPMQTAVVRALHSRANLTRANLTRADLTRADLTGVNLTRADLTRADLTGVNLTDADLTGVNLTRADLTGADLTDADLTGVNLTDANLTGVNLTRADLTGVNLTGANLTRANLTDADLTGVNLTGANLTDANLTGVNLTRADLTGAREDFRSVLDAAPLEVAGLLLAIREGRIDGSHYEGECACLVGTIANVRGCNYQSLSGIEPNSSRPSERLFMGISPGHVPAINPVAKIVEGWIVEWQTERAAVQP